jgi:tetratricopeptide (TPR) repeat protein
MFRFQARRFLLSFLILLSFTCLKAPGVMPPEVYNKKAKESKIKAIAVVKEIKVMDTHDGVEEKLVTFALQKSFSSDFISNDFMGTCLTPVKGSKPMPGKAIYFYPRVGEKVFVSILGNGGEITSYTLMSEGLQKALKTSPDKITFSMGKVLVNDGTSELIRKARILMEKKDYTSAQLELHKALAINDKLATAYYLNGKVYEAQSNQDKAIEYFNRAVELDKDYFEAYYKLGRIYFSRHKPEKAVENFKKVLSIQPGDSDALFALGLSLNKLEKYKEAVTAFTKAIKLTPNYAPSYYYRGIAYKNLKDNDNARKDFEQALKFNSKYADACYQLGQLNALDGNYDKALASYDMVSKISPEYIGSYVSKGMIYSKKHNYSEAIKEFSKAVKLDPKLSLVYFYRGNAYRATGDYDKAIEDFKKVLEFESTNAWAHKQLGTVYFISSKYKKAIQHLKEANRLDHNDTYTPIYLYLTEARRNSHKAKADLDKFAEKHQGSEWIMPVINMYLHKITPEECLAAAKDKEKQCEAYFYIGEYYLLKKEKNKAEENFRKCIATGIKNFAEYGFAEYRLKNLKESATK